MSILTISEAAYEAGKAAIADYPIHESDRFDVAIMAINAATPLILEDELTRIADELDKLRITIVQDHSYRSFTRANGINEAVAHILLRIEHLRAGQTVFKALYIRGTDLNHLPQRHIRKALDPGSAAAAGEAYTQRHHDEPPTVNLDNATLDLLAWDISDAFAKDVDRHGLDLGLDEIRAALPAFIDAVRGNATEQDGEARHEQ